MNNFNQGQNSEQKRTSRLVWAHMLRLQCGLNHASVQISAVFQLITAV